MSNFIKRAAIGVLGVLNEIALAFCVLASAALIYLSFDYGRKLESSGFSLFVVFFWVWLAVNAAYFVFVIALGRDRFNEKHWSFTPMFVMALIMLARVGPSANLLWEIWIAVGAHAALQLLYLFTPTARSPRVMAVAGNNPQQEAPQQVAIRYEAVKPRFSFADVTGMKEVKSRLIAAGREVVASQKANAQADKAKAQGQAKPKVQARNGVLLTGKPGNGKTFLAEALAGELKLPFLAVSYGDVASKYINDTPENVVKVFRDAAAQAPCVLFIDEIDSLISTRNANSTYEESARVTNVLLTELVNIRRLGVVVVAASNFVDRLDPAAIREGRFDFKVEITPPDSVARRHLILTKCKQIISEETIDTAVRRWEGFSVARITAVMEEANRMKTPAGLLIFENLQTALRAIQGRKGSIPEDTPTINELTMDPESKQRLQALAYRMDKIMEIEALGGSVPRGVLFYGPPGTGKTLTARALCKTANWAFLSVSGMDLISDPKKIDALVEEASELRPCVVFIDEADDVFRNRRYSNTATVTNKLLAAMDGSGGKVPDILFVAATNHPDEMDSAALRGGRFTEKIEFGLPSSSILVEFLRKWKSTTKARISPKLCLDRAARRLEGNSMANVREILQMAVNNAIGRMDPDDEIAVVEMRDIDAAIGSVQGNIATA